MKIIEKIKNLTKERRLRKNLKEEFGCYWDKELNPRCLNCKHILFENPNAWLIGDLDKDGIFYNLLWCFSSVCETPYVLKRTNGEVISLTDAKMEMEKRKELCGGNKLKPKGKLKLDHVDLEHKEGLSLYFNIYLKDENGTMFSARSSCFEFDLMEVKEEK